MLIQTTRSPAVARVGLLGRPWWLKSWKMHIFPTMPLFNPKFENVSLAPDC